MTPQGNSDKNHKTTIFPWFSYGLPIDLPLHVGKPAGAPPAPRLPLGTQATQIHFFSPRTKRQKTPPPIGGVGGTRALAHSINISQGKFRFLTIDMANMI